jgi:hypothetical protein
MGKNNKFRTTVVRMARVEWMKLAQECVAGFDINGV